MAYTWLSTILSSKVSLPDAIDFRALCDADLVTLLSKFRADVTLVLHLADDCKRDKVSNLSTSNTCNEFAFIDRTVAGTD